jgi:hypothetical protein
MNEAMRLIPGLSVCLCLSATASAQQPSLELRAGGQLYLHSVGLPKEAQVCERYIPGYRNLFDPLYDSWKKRHKELMDRAQQLMREAAQNRQVEGTGRQLRCCLPWSLRFSAAAHRSP